MEWQTAQTAWIGMAFFGWVYIYIKGAGDGAINKKDIRIISLIGFGVFLGALFNSVIY